ncbi:MAG TPA: tetratricopeptide repeat protein, partial [Polyangiaceae bacterium]|nr:tetratricopeptide repeat protein [Polyangiaceae bacterium]
GQPAAAREAFGAMLDLADLLGLAGKRGAALNRLGRAHRDCGDFAQARRCFEYALAAFKLAGDARGLSATKDDFGKLLLLEGDYLAALPLLRSGLEERKAIGDRRSVAVSLTNVALVWHEQGKSSVAEEALGIAHQLFGMEGDARGRCDALLSLGKLATHRRDFGRAEQHFRSAHALAAEAQDRGRMARSLAQIGETKLRVNDVAAAEPLLERAIELGESVEAWLDVAEARRALAKLQLKRRRLGEARRNIRVSLHLARRVQSRVQLAATLRTLAEIAAAGAWSSSTAGRAVGYYMLSIELAKQTNNELELAKGYRSFARYAERYERREIREQSNILRDLSDEIFQRHEVRS